MADQAEATRTSALYDTDFFAWTQEQAQAIEQGRWSDVDRVNVADEIASLGVQVRREATDRIEILISYLLKWRHLAEYRGKAWKENVSRQRSELAKIFVDNPSLLTQRESLVADAYEDGRRRLKYETYFYETDFPASCPFAVNEVFDPAYFPEELDGPAFGAFPTALKIA